MSRHSFMSRARLDMWYDSCGTTNYVFGIFTWWKPYHVIKKTWPIDPILPPLLSLPIEGRERKGKDGFWAKFFLKSHSIFFRFVSKNNIFHLCNNIDLTIFTKYNHKKSTKSKVGLPYPIITFLHPYFTS